MSLNNLKKDLECPITQDLLEDPVRVSCCQKAFSREPLIRVFDTTGTCPACRAYLHEDPRTTPKDILLAGMVETCRQQNRDPYQPHGWYSNITPIIDLSGLQLPVGELSLTLENSQFDLKPSLFIAVCDNSGSMAGNPWNQVKTALVHLYSMTRNNPLVKVKLITYNSMAQIIAIDPQQSPDIIKNTIEGLRAGGGTNIKSSFEKIQEIIREHQCETITIAIMTDGQDNAVYGKPDEARVNLVDEFKEVLMEEMNGNGGGGNKIITVCTVGFSGGHDRKLLELFRESGTVPGTYQYAEPRDDGDTLCQKLQSLFEMATQNSSVTLNLELTNTTFLDGQTTSNIQFPVDQRGRGVFKCWVNLINLNNINLNNINLNNINPIDSNPGEIIINSTCDNNTTVRIIKHDNIQKGCKLFEKWLDTQVDQIAKETLQLGESNPSINIMNLHCGIINQKIDAMINVARSESTLRNLTAISEQVDMLLAGKQVNLNKLADLSYSSKFNNKVSVTTPETRPTIVGEIGKLQNETVWKEMELRRYNRNNAGKQRNLLQEAIMNNSWNKMTPEITNLINSSTLNIATFTDIDGNNSLHLAAYCGQVETTKLILTKYPDFPLETVNLQGETALTLAIKKRGFWLTIKELLTAGAIIPEGRKSALEQYCVNHGFVETAGILSNLSENGGTGTDINMSMTSSYVQYVYDQAQVNNKTIDVQKFLDISLAKGMNKLATIMMETHNATPTIDMLLCHCIPSKPDDPKTEKYLNLAKMVLDHTPDLVHQTDENGDGPVLTAARKGSLPHVTYFLQQGASLDQQNNLGNSALWIACSQRYPCIVDELVDWGADPNLVNDKGNGPLYSVCQHGPKKIAETLISYGANINHKNNNGDTLVLISCRNGQSEVLELLLQYVSPEFVNFKAEIDGFNAIMACAEANKPECIRVLANYFANDTDFLDQTTSLDCPVPDVAGGSSLHIAAYYNCVDAARELLNLGANPNFQEGKYLRTSLHIAVIQGHISMIKLLRDHGADQNITDINMNTAAAYCRNKTDIRKVLVDPLLDPLMKLCQSGFDNTEECEACNILKRHTGIPGVITTSKSVSLVSSLGMTPLTAAVINSKFGIVETLVGLGADPTVKNLHGIDVWLWAEWINNPRIKAILPTCPHPEKIQSQVQILKSEKNPFVLFLGNRPDTVVTSHTSGIIQRMNYFTNTVTYPARNIHKVLSISESETETNSRTGGSSVKDLKRIFKLDDFKRSESSYDALLWNARVFTVSVMASGHSLGLNANQVLALILYTSNCQIARKLNEALIKNINGDVTELDETIKKYGSELYTGLIQLPVHDNEVYMGSSSVSRDLYLPNNEIVWPTFMSASGLWKVAAEACPSFEKVSGVNSKAEGTIFIIKSKTGRSVAQFSQFSYDSEVIFVPGTKFKVTNWYRGDVICLGQSNIREHTFKIKEEDMSQYINSQKSLIIELTEIIDN